MCVLVLIHKQTLVDCHDYQYTNTPAALHNTIQHHTNASKQMLIFTFGGTVIFHKTKPAVAV